MGRRFTHINHQFNCENCGKLVPELKKSCRNHCPYCLHSKHVDILPGDRLNLCHGLMAPTGYRTQPKKGVQIEFRCNRCGDRGYNKAALDDPNAGDDYDLLLSLRPMDRATRT